MNYQTSCRLIHPEDADKAIDQMIKNAPFGSDIFQTRYRVKTNGGNYAWIETAAGLTTFLGAGF